MARKLDKVLQELTPLAERGKITRFLNSTEDVDKLSGLVEDIRDAMMDYQVGPQGSCTNPNLTFVTDITTTRHLQKELPTHCESFSLNICPLIVTGK